jgi:hypothetical protein
MTDLLTFGPAVICLAISWLLEWTDPPKVIQSSRRSSRKPRRKPRFTGNVIVLSEYKRRIKSRGNPETA